MRKFIHAASAFGLVAAMAMAVPPGPGARAIEETPGAVRSGNSPYHAASATFTQVLSTGFESPDWMNGASVCGSQFLFDECDTVSGFCVLDPLDACVTNADCADAAADVTCTYPVSNVCLFKNHAANQNCCPDSPHDPTQGDPNEETGWSMSPSGRHCRFPGVRSNNPFAGTQHLHFEYDALGGVPAGCSGFGSACRQRAITAQVAQADVSRAVWSMEINWEQVGQSSMVQFAGMDTSNGSISLSSYIYWYYAGYLFIYDFNVPTFVFGGYWSDYLGVYTNFTADYDPCNDTVTYFYNGAQVHAEQFGFHPPYGDLFNDVNGDTRAGTSPDSAFYTTDHFDTAIDIDNHFVTYTPCTDACCDGATGTCTDGADANSCSGPMQHYYPNVPCSLLGTGPKYPPACDRDTGACCDHGPLAGGPGPGGVCTSDVLPEACAGAQQTYTNGAACVGSAGTCDVGRAAADACAGGFCNGPFGKVGAICATFTDCDVPGFCSSGKTGDLCSSDADCAIPAIDPCMEDTGACCHAGQPGGVCVDGILSADCVGEFETWYKLSDCASETCDALGACCDEILGTCTNKVAEQDCQGPWKAFTLGTLCPDAPACNQLGACCNTLAGSCVERSLEADCQGAQRVWSVGTFCADSACAAITGACCDQDPFGGCSMTTLAGCNCDKCEGNWYKDQLCSEIECVHNSIPTVSEWGLVVLTLLLLTGAKVYFGRREAVA